MAAGNWKDWLQAELVTESGFQDIQDSIVFIYASEAAADAALTNKVTGTIFYDTTAEVIKAWNGSSWISAETGDISSVIAGTNLNGGGTSGDVTVNLDSTLTGIDDVQDSGSTSLVGRKNYLINGNFDVWQRGASLTGQTGGKYLADRWRTEPSGATYDYDRGTFTVGQTDVPNNPEFYADFTVTSADDNFRPEQRIEDVKTLASETITISFWAKYTSNAPTDFRTTIRQYFGSGGSSDVYTVFASGQTLTTSWQKFEVTGTVPSISGKTIGTGNLLSISPFWNGNNETFDVQIAQVQVEKGSVATDFEVRPIAEELALCHRYYQDSGNTGARYIVMGMMQSQTEFRGLIPISTPMRTNPTITLGTSQVLANDRGYDSNGVTVSSSSNILGGIAVTIATAATSGTFAAFTGAGLRCTDILLDAEL